MHFSFMLVALALGTTVTFPVISDAGYSNGIFSFPEQVTMEMLKAEISSLQILVAEVNTSYLSTQGKISLEDPFMHSKDPHGTKTALVWMTFRYNMAELKTAPTLEGVLWFYRVATIYPLDYSWRFRTATGRLVTDRFHCEFSNELDLMKLPRDRPQAAIQAHVQRKLKQLAKLKNHLKGSLLTCIISRTIFYYRVLRLLHYASIVFADNGISHGNISLRQAGQTLMTKLFDEEASFNQLFFPLTAKFLQIHSILMDGKLDITDSEHSLGKVLHEHRSEWDSLAGKERVHAIEQAYIMPFLRLKEAKYKIADDITSQLVAAEALVLAKKSRVSKEAARIRITIRKNTEKNVEEEVEETNSPGEEVQVESWTSWKFADFTEALQTTVYVILAQHYRECYLLPILDAMEDDGADEEGSGFSWELFAADPKVQGKAKSMFNLKVDDLAEMAQVVTYRNHLCHRRTLPDRLEIQHPLASLLGVSLAQDAADILSAAQIQIVSQPTDLVDSLYPGINSGYAEITFTLLTALLACQSVNGMADQCKRLEVYRQGYAHPNSKRFSRLIPRLTRIK